MKGMLATVVIMGPLLPGIACAQENIAARSTLHPALVDGVMTASSEEACVNNSSFGPGWNPGESITIEFPRIVRISGFGIFMGELNFGEVASGTIERGAADGTWVPVLNFVNVGARNGNERIPLDQTVEASSFRLTMSDGGGGADSNICVREIQIYGTLLARPPLIVELPDTLEYSHPNDDGPIVVTLTDQLQYIHESREPITVTLTDQLQYIHESREPITVTLTDQLQYIHESREPITVTLTDALSYRHVEAEPLTVVLSESLAYLHGRKEPTHSEFSVDARAHASSGDLGLATGLLIGEADRLTIRAAPNQAWSAGPPEGNCSRAGTAEGLSAACFGQLSQNGFSANYGSLVGRIGDGDYFFIGDLYDGVTGSSGELRLYFWDDYDEDNMGAISVTVTLTPASR